MIGKWSAEHGLSVFQHDAGCYTDPDHCKTVSWMMMMLHIIN